MTTISSAYQIPIAILGATGYTALELLKILEQHPHARVVALTSRESTKSLGEVHPYFAQRSNLVMENLTPAEVAARVNENLGGGNHASKNNNENHEKCGCVFSCLPHTASARAVPELLAAGIKVVDLSADYRLDSPDIFRQWYAEEHPDPARLGATPYGLPELFRSEIQAAAQKKASLVANPGCYPTSAILPLAPFLKLGLIATQSIVIDAKSGVSGAGRQPKMVSLYPECNESIAAYGIGTHRHTPEITQILSRVAQQSVSVIFSPHLTPMDRGILSTIYAPLNVPLTSEEALGTLRTFYEHEPFVQIVEHFPATKEVSGTNNCHITARIVNGHLILVSVIDNLIKGASGAAVQNFNLLFGFDERLALMPQNGVVA